MTATAPTAPTAPGVRSWWGIPYATAERYRRPVLVDFDPERPYDRKGVVSAVVDRPTSGSVGNLPFEATGHYQAVLDLFEGIDRP